MNNELFLLGCCIIAVAVVGAGWLIARALEDARGSSQQQCEDEHKKGGEPHG